MVDGITEVVNNAGYQVLLANTGNDTEKELEYLKTFRLNNVDGVIFIGTLMTKKHLALMKSYKKPIVLMGQQESEVSSVYFDDYGCSTAGDRLSCPLRLQEYRTPCRYLKG